ncbi:MAG: hypothetical protein M4579_005435, partial [Chaenotheca gracillima]
MATTNQHAPAPAGSSLLSSSQQSSQDKGDQALNLKSLRDLYLLSESFSEEDDEDGRPIFMFSAFGYMTDDHVAYFGQSELR